MIGVLDLADLAQAQAGTGTGYTVYRTVVPAKPPGAYAVLYPTGGRSFSTRLAQSPTELRWSFRVVCAGYSERQALNTADRIRACFTDWRPLGVNGPRANELDYDAPLIRDDAVASDIRYSLTLTFRLTFNAGVAPELIDPSQLQVGTGPPTSSTTGRLYLDTNTGDLYRLTDGG